MESKKDCVNVIEDLTNNVTPSKYHEAIFNSMLIDSCLGDIKNVNINKYFTSKGNLLEPVSEMFCDNIMLYKIRRYNKRK
jgi:hypothetical protein